jgi:hypothetical protein
VNLVPPPGLYRGNVLFSESAECQYFSRLYHRRFGRASGFDRVNPVLNLSSRIGR